MREKSSVAATAAMWPAVLPGGRPVGRRAELRPCHWQGLARNLRSARLSAGSTLEFGRSFAEAFIIRQAAGHRQVADFNVERP